MGTSPRNSNSLKPQNIRVCKTVTTWYNNNNVGSLKPCVFNQSKITMQLSILLLNNYNNKSIKIIAVLFYMQCQVQPLALRILLILEQDQLI